MEKKEIEELLNQKVAEMKRSLVPHTCFTCAWFIMRTEKPRNRACRFPDALVVKGNRCLSWKFEEDPAKRGQGLC
jgi:hypothetical protein